MRDLQYLKCNQFVVASSLSPIVSLHEILRLPTLRTLHVLPNKGDPSYGAPIDSQTLRPRFSAQNLTTLNLVDYECYFPMDDFTNLEHAEGVSMRNLLPYGRKMSTKIDAEHQLRPKPYYRVLKSVSFYFLHPRNPLEHEYANVLFASLIHAKQFEQLRIGVVGDLVTRHDRQFTIAAPTNRAKVPKLSVADEVVAGGACPASIFQAVFGVAMLGTTSSDSKAMRDTPTSSGWDWSSDSSSDSSSGSSSDY